jgi:hypothetical protein
MITVAAEPPPFEKRALAISAALHCCGLAVLVALVPVTQASVGGHGMRDLAARCSNPCAEVFALRIEHRARAAIVSGARRVAALLPARRPEEHVAPKRTNMTTITFHHRAARVVPVQNAPERPVETGALASASGDRGTNANVTLATQASEDPVASKMQPNTIGANPSNGIETASDASPNRGMLGPANWGSHADIPTLRDRALQEEILTKIGRRGVVTISVDDQGRATEVKINVPGLDAAAIEDLRKRLLAARYIPVERDGIAFDGTLKIAATP